MDVIVVALQATVTGLLPGVTIGTDLLLQRHKTAGMCRVRIRVDAPVVPYPHELGPKEIDVTCLTLRLMTLGTVFRRQ